MWYRVAALKPRLRANIRVQRQRYRGDDWYLLIDDASERVVRIGADAYAFIGRCDGQRTAQGVWDFLAGEAGESLPAQDGLLRLMMRLQESGLLSFDRRPDVGSVFERRRKRERRQRIGELNPLFFRVRLGDPSALLRRLAPLGRLLFGAAGLWLWCAALALAAVAAVLQIDPLAAHASELSRGTRLLWLTWLIYPPVKLIHELAHGLAVRRWGGEAREWGVSLLVLMPVPWVDVSAANGFRRGHQRLVVSAAGILAELALAAVALLVWSMVEAGVVRDAAMVVMLVAAVSTLLVTGNPLLRFDGYYVLVDLFDLPNLAPRSRRWWQQGLRRRLLGLDPADALFPARGESAWLFAYQPLSWLYRLGLCTGIVLWLGNRTPLFAYVAAAWFGWTLLAKPTVDLFKALLDDRLPEANRMRARLLAVVLAVVLPVGLFAVPVPDVTVAQGIVWLPDDARLRADVEGFIEPLSRRDGDRVQAGDVVARLRNDQLLTRREELAREIEGLEIEWFRQLRADPARAAITDQRMRASRHEATRIDEQIAALTVRAARTGRLVIPQQADLPGRFLPRGEVFGMVFDGQPSRVRVALPNAEATLLEDLEGVEVRLADAPGSAVTAELLGQVPAAGMRLPSAALGNAAGGDMVVDPADADGLATLQAVVWVDLRLPVDVSAFSGGRAAVRFEHSPASIASQAWRQLRQLLLGHFDPNGAAWIR